MVSFLVAMKTQMRKPDAEQSPYDSKSFEDEADFFSVSKKKNLLLNTNIEVFKVLATIITGLLPGIMSINFGA